MSTQKVTDKILEDAKIEAGAILVKYEKEAKSIADELGDRITQKRKQVEKEIAERKETEIMRTVSQQRLALNMKQTAHKRLIIQNIVDEAVAELPAHKDYLTFLKNLISKSGATEGALLLSKNDFSRYRGDLEKYLRSEGINLEITQDAGIRGGLIIKRGTTNYIGSLDIILELLSDEMAIAISKVLF